MEEGKWVMRKGGKEGRKEGLKGKGPSETCEGEPLVLPNVLIGSLSCIEKTLVLASFLISPRQSWNLAGIKRQAS